MLLKVDLLIFVAVALTGCRVKAQFSRQPQSVVQAQGLEAVFECQYNGMPGDSITYEWFINGHGELFHGSKSVRSIAPPYHGGPAYVIVTALPEYDSTTIQCEVDVRRPGVRELYVSIIGTLKVQGPLDPITNLLEYSSNTSITISWTAPFSLNLTTAEPDIQYCVDVYNVLGGEDNHIHSECNIIDTSYTFPASDPNQLFSFTVTPRSNVEGGHNGTTSQPILGHLIGDFTMQPQSVVQVQGLKVIFECQNNNNAIIYNWFINGRRYTGAPSSIRGNTTLCHPDGPVFLIITALPQYHNTMVQYMGTIRGRALKLELVLSMLKVQGPLRQIPNLCFSLVNLSNTSITISWTAPSSLNLTTAEPDIQYCVNMYSVTGGKDNYIHSECNSTDTSYTFPASDPDQLLSFTVTPKSNIEGSFINGTTSQRLRVRRYLPGHAMDSMGHMHNQQVSTIWIITGSVVNAILIIVLCLIIVCCYIYKRKFQLRTINQPQEEAGEVDLSGIFPGIEHPNEAYSTVLTQNISYEVIRPQRQRSSSGRVHTSDIQLPNIYEEVLPQDH